MRLRALAVLVALGVLPACAPGTRGTLVPLRVYATSAASPWLRNAYDCTPTGAGLILTGPDDAEVLIRLTEPLSLTRYAYQVGEDDLLVVTHPEVAVGQLSVRQVEALFTGEVDNWHDVGGADLEVQVWSYAPTVDVQTFFDREMLHGRPVSSLARLAVSAQDMSDLVGSVPGSVGLLPRTWKAGNTRDVMQISSVPVLALTDQLPEGLLAQLIACMQAKS